VNVDVEKKKKKKKEKNIVKVNMCGCIFFMDVFL